MMNETYNGVEPHQKEQMAPKARTESAESLGSRSESKTSLAGKTDDDKAGALGQVKFTKTTNESAVEIGAVDVAFAGMGKEELMKYANDPFWVRLRWALFILFWLVWLAMLVIAVVIVVLAPKCPAPAPLDYWQKGVVYSVNLKSFQDGAQQDGKGDIQGLMGRLKHFVYLGVNMVSISPIFKTANDNEALYGQDVVDFYEMNPAYGFPKDVKELTAAAKQEGIKIILDLPINHVSDQHVWFKNSVNNRTGSCGDCFIWHDGINGSPPNNWVSVFDGSAWTSSPNRSQFYYHAYGTNQPDLNFRSPKVKEEIKSIMKFWLNRGVAGFRLLSVPYLFETEDLSLDESTPGQHTMNLQETYNFIGEIRQFLKEFEDKDGDHRVLIVEAENTEVESAIKYYGDYAADQLLADVVVNADLTQRNQGFSGKQLLNDVLPYLAKVELVKGCPNWMFGNADKERVATRIEENLIDALAMVQLLLPGVPFVYYGEEIGMEDVPPTGGSTINCRGPTTPTYTCNQARSPYQWDSTPETAGFTNGTIPWYPVGQESINAKDQMGESVSHLNVYRDLIQLRKQPAMMYGTVHFPANLTTENIFTFTRIRKGAPGYLIVINLGESMEMVNYANEDSIPSDASVVVRSTIAKDPLQVKGSTVNTRNVTIGSKEGLVLSFVPIFTKS